MVDEQKLQELAAAATPGPWIAGDDEDSDYFLVGPHDGDGLVYQPVVKLHSEANADFIAAANPAAILALLDEIQTLRAAVKQAREDAQPVAQIVRASDAHGTVKWLVHNGRPIRVGQMLYTSPPKQVPLTITPVTQAMEMYAKHPTYRGERALSWLEAPQAVRDEWMAKASHGIGTAAPAKTQGGES